MLSYVSFSAVRGIQALHYYIYGPASDVTVVQTPPITDYLEHY